MPRPNSIARLALVPTIVAASSAIASAAESSSAELRNEIQALQDKVSALEARQASSSKDLAASIDSLLRDAERRSQLLATGGEASAGYDNGFFIRAGDAWVFRPGVQFQFRNVANFRENAKTDGGDSFDDGFELRRLRFSLEGKVLSKDLDYYFQWDFPRDGGGATLLEAWARYFFADDWGLRVGQIKDQTTHEWLISAKRLMAADRSLVDNLIGGTTTAWTQGVTVIYGGGRDNNNPLSVEAGYTDGANQYNTDFTGRGEPLPSPEPTVTGIPKPHAFDWGMTGRAEYKIFGDWKDYRDFTARDTKQQLLVIGAGSDRSQGGDGNLVLGTADVQYKHPNGLSLYAAGIVRYLDTALSGAANNTTDWGALAQASYAIDGVWEIFARYDVMLFDNAAKLARAGTATGDLQDTFHEITAGVNYYLGQNGSAGHRAKITVDLTYLPNGAPKSVNGLGILGDNEGQAEWVLRTQFQLLL